jgi:nucleotide-binding universal stress UspA family protein
MLHVATPTRIPVADRQDERLRAAPVDDPDLEPLPTAHTTKDRMKIIVGYDGSEAAKRALERAAAVAGDHGRIVVIAVGEPYPRSGITIPANHDPAEIVRRRRELRRARQFLSTRGIQAETVQAWGNPADVLLAASRDADLVIVGSRGLNRLQRLVLGSVSSKIVHDAACDVLVVR